LIPLERETVEVWGKKVIDLGSPGKRRGRGVCQKKLLKLPKKGEEEREKSSLIGRGGFTKKDIPTGGKKKKTLSYPEGNTLNALQLYRIGGNNGLCAR